MPQGMASSGEGTAVPSLRGFSSPRSLGSKAACPRYTDLHTPIGSLKVCVVGGEASAAQGAARTARASGPDCSSCSHPPLGPKGDRGSLTAILEVIADAVVRQIPFRRVVVSAYAQPLTPGEGVSTVAEYAARGLAPDDEALLQKFIADGGTVTGSRFSSRYRIGYCFYIPAGSSSESIFPVVRSRRRFLVPNGWRSGDLLLAPIESEGQILGTISVDDPRDGARPSEQTLRTLEGLARMAAALLRERMRGQSFDDEHSLFRVLAEHCMTGFLVTEGESISYVNQRVVDLFGYSRDELLAMRPWWQLIHPDERGAVLRREEVSVQRTGVRARGARKDSSTLWLLVRSYPLEYQHRQAHIIDLLDISEQVHTEALLREKAMHDPLTGLFNRHYFDETIYTELNRSRRYRRPFTLLMIDLRGFKRVNDQFGHARGDEVLKAVGGLIRRTLRESDWVVRYGGDEFLIVLPETAGPVDALLQRLRTAVELWNREHLPEIPIVIDAGWATWTADRSCTLQELLEAADAQMYTAKRRREIPS